MEAYTFTVANEDYKSDMIFVNLFFSAINLCARTTRNSYRFIMEPCAILGRFCCCSPANKELHPGWVSMGSVGLNPSTAPPSPANHYFDIPLLIQLLGHSYSEKCSNSIFPSSWGRQPCSFTMITCTVMCGIQRQSMGIGASSEFSGLIEWVNFSAKQIDSPKWFKSRIGMHYQLLFPRELA